MKTIFCFLIVLLFLPFAYAENVPPKINYQGYLTSGYSGEVSVKVAIVNKDGNTTYWSNDGASVNGSEPRDVISISATDGFFNVVLGDTEIPDMKALDKAIFGNGERLYIRVWVKAGTDVFERLSPDQEIVSTPYAIKADTADIENIKTALSSDFHNIGGTDDDQPDSDSEVPDDISINNITLYAPSGGGKVGIGKIDPATELDVNGTVTAKTFIGDGSKLTGVQAAQDTDWTISGMNIYRGYGCVGIGTTSPAVKLDVNGTVRAQYFIGDGSNLTGIQQSASSKVYFAFGKDNVSTAYYLFTTIPNMQITQNFPAGKMYIHFNAPIKPGIPNRHFDPFVALFIDGVFTSVYSRIIEENPGDSYKNITLDWVQFIPAGNHTIEIKWAAGYYISPADTNPIIQIGSRCPRTLTIICGQ